MSPGGGKEDGNMDAMGRGVEMNLWGGDVFMGRGSRIN